MFADQIPQFVTELVDRRVRVVSLKQTGDGRLDVALGQDRRQAFPRR
jgi:hypothetical protein